MHLCRSQVVFDQPHEKYKKQYLVKFKDSWCDKFNFIRKSSKGDTFAFCRVCRIDINVGHEGENDINRHIATSKYKEYCVDALEKKTKITDWGASSATSDLDQKVSKAELLFAGLILVEHNLPLATADHAGKLFKSMFPDSKVATKYQSGRIKTSHMLTGSVAKHLTDELKEELSLTQ